MISGIITAVLLGLELMMFLLKYSKKLKKNIYHGKTGKTLLFLHEATGFALLAVSVYHLISVWKLLHQRPLLTYITGIAMVICIAAAVISFLFRNRCKKWWVIHHSASGILLVLIAVHIVCSIVSLNQYKSEMNAVEITDMNAAGLPDGSYTGECNVGYIYAKVRVDVANETISDIKLLEHRNERGSSAEAITDIMKQKQDVKVDAVSGATNSSRVIMKAAENALESAEKK